jgi:hypothetical protein
MQGVDFIYVGYLEILVNKFGLFYIGLLRPT